MSGKQGSKGVKMADFRERERGREERERDRGKVMMV